MENGSGVVNDRKALAPEGFPGLLRLNAQDEAADGNLFVGSDGYAFATRNLFPVQKRWVSTLGYHPVAALVVERQDCVHAANFRIAFDWQIDGDGSRAAADADFGFGNRHDRLAYAV